LVAGAAAGIYLAKRESLTGATTIKPLLGGAAAALFTNLPDFLEPATSPNHRSTFHSVACAAFLGMCLHRLNQWQPQTDSEKLMKCVGMLTISAYLIHLALDFTTAKSLPLIG
jgi:membrane-bound metal-dependent hydrolase YbcI (DUF457 family)